MTALALDDNAMIRIRTVQWAVRLVFLMSGLAAGTWGVVVPFAKDGLDLAQSHLGLIMLSGGFGGVLAMPLGGLLINRYGSRKTIFGAGMVLAVVVMLIMVTPSALALAAVLFYFGLSIGILDVAMNAHAVIVETRSGRAAMSSFHGFFSGGALIAPLVMGALLNIGLTPAACLILIGVAMMGVIVTQSRVLFPSSADSRSSGGTGFTMPRGGAWLLGLFAFIFYMAEGTMFDWTSLFLRDYRGFDPAWAGLGLAGFSVSMTLVRLTGDGLVQRFGRASLVAGGGALAVFGMLLAVSVPSAWVGILGFTLFGLGAGNIVPIVFSAAGRLPGFSASVAIAAVATLGNCGTLIGPGAIGFASDIVGLPMALGIVAVVMAAVIASARFVRLGND